VSGRIRTFLGAAGIAAAVLLVYLSQWGRLFPYSPVALGFTKHELPHMVVLVENGAEFSDFTCLDTLIPVVEGFHEMRFLHKPRLYFFRDSASYLRRSPSRARFYTCANGNVVISPWAVREDKEHTIPLATYLRHELSHSLLSQNMDILAAYRYPKWLLEGIAVYSADQMGTSWYSSKVETYALMRQGNYMPPDCFKTRREDGIKLDVPYRMTFMYSEFGCIVDYLVESYGRDRFLEYMKRLCKTGGHKGAFEEVFGIGFDTFIDQFKEHVSSITDPAPAVQHRGKSGARYARHFPYF
jgi:hypothetical protein